MDSLAQLQSMGLELPSGWFIFGSIVFGLVGLVAFRNGRKTGHRHTVWFGVALMFYPYAVSKTWLLYVVGVLLCAAMWLDRRRS